MAYEIERKFLVRDDSWREQAGLGRGLRQAYLAYDGAVSVRVRIIDGTSATLTLKSNEMTLRRQEFEYDVPLPDAEELLALRRGSVVEKIRFKVPSGALTWEIDVFSGDNLGLVIAEIELPDEEQRFGRPAWLGDEITGDARYYNASLAAHPYCRWRDDAARPLV